MTDLVRNLTKWRHTYDAFEKTFQIPAYWLYIGFNPHSRFFKNLPMHHTLFKGPRFICMLKTLVFSSLNVPLESSPGDKMTNLVRNLNAISEVHHFQSCISLNKRLWANSKNWDLKRSFCRIDLKFFSVLN